MRQIQRLLSEKVFVSQERVSGFPEKGADLRGSPGTSGEVWGTSGEVWELSGPLNRLNAILSLLHPLDRYRTPIAIGSAIGRPLSRPISHPNTGGSPQPPRSKPLRGLNRAIVVL